MVTVEDSDGLGKAMKQGEDTIEVKGALAGHISRMWGMDRVLWKICLILLATVVLLVLALPAGSPVMMQAVAASPAAGILGTKTAAAAVRIAVAGGGISILGKLKDYRLKEMNERHIILHRK